MFAVVEMLPLPDAAPHDEPADAEQVQVGDTSCGASGSVIVAPITFDGPWLLTDTVYVMVLPANLVPALDFVTTRSTRGVTLSVSVAELLAVEGSVVPEPAVAVAVLTSVPVPAAVDGLRVPVTV